MGRRGQLKRHARLVPRVPPCLAQCPRRSLSRELARPREPTLELAKPRSEGQICPRVRPLTRLHNVNEDEAFAPSSFSFSALTETQFERLGLYGGLAQARARPSI